MTHRLDAVYWHAAPYPVETARPIIKITGGKRQLLPRLRDHIPLAFFDPELASDRTYVEPFFGGGALFFDLCNRGFTGPAFLSDVSAGLVGLHRAVRDHAGEVAERYARLRAKYDAQGTDDERRAFYDYIRSLDVEDHSAPVAAARRLFLNRCSFNGLWRENKRGGMNAPWGKKGKGELPEVEALRLDAAAQALRGTMLTEVDFEDALTLPEGDPATRLIYFDPPYLPADGLASSGFTTYAAGGFGVEDHARLAALSVELVQRGCGRVLLSASDTATSREVYAALVRAGFAVKRVEARRAVNRDGAGRGPVGELLYVGGRG